MKASLKLGEDGLPLLTAKLPFTLAGAPLASGLSASSSRDLSLYVGTLSVAGPSCKVAYRPNNSSGLLSFVLKTGSGLWGSPNGAAIAMAVEFMLWGKGGPFFSLCVRPRIGDFCLRKYVRTLLVKPRDRAVDLSGCGAVAERGFGAAGGKSSISEGIPLLQLDTSSLSVPVSNRDNLLHLQEAEVESFSAGVPGSTPREERRNLFSKSSEATASNLYSKADVVDTENIEGEKAITVDGLKDQGMAGVSGLSERGFVAGVSNDIAQEDTRSNCVHETGRSKVEASSIWPIGFDGCFRGWNLNAHSSLPLGKRAKLNIRWGLKVPSSFCWSWGSMPSGFSVTSLPFFLMDKISVESVNPAVHTPLSTNFRFNEVSSPWAYGLQSSGSIEDSCDLVHVMAMCRSMKRQVQLLYAENRVLRRTMEEMSAEFEYRSGINTWKTAGSASEVPVQKSGISPPQLLQNPQNFKENKFNHGDSLGKKNGRDLSRKDSFFDRNGVSSEKSLSSGGSQSEVSEELKKVILNTTRSPIGEKAE